ncbi:MAG: hypothetical protein AB7N80_00030 [Bdellovibrionales bacterium]
MTIKFVLGVLVATTISFQSRAQESDSTTSTSTKSLLQNKKFEETHTLTDSKLRADDGSLSRYSMKGNVSYFGPTLHDWSAADQPNPDGSVGSYAQALKGSAMLRYRISSVSTVSAGTGLAVNHPFHGWDRTDVNNPFMSYDRSIRLGQLQMRTSPGFMIATVPNFTTTGEVGGLTLDQSTVWNIPGSRFALSLDGNFSWWIYKRSYIPGPISRGGDGKAQEYSLGLFPGLKYNFSDRVSMFTSYALSFYNPRLLDDKGALWRRTPSARLGISYAAGRDIYVAPYLSSYPGEAFTRSTTFNLSTVFSIL